SDRRITQLDHDVDAAVDQLSYEGGNTVGLLFRIEDYEPEVTPLLPAELMHRLSERPHKVVTTTLSTEAHATDHGHPRLLRRPTPRQERRRTGDQQTTR